MTFSVVIATHNRLNHLPQVLAAVQNQDFDGHDFELIVVDDASNDGTGDYLKSLRWERGHLVCLSQEHKGPAAARNLGISRAVGEIVAFTDDDCLVPPDWLKQLAIGYRAFPAAGGVGGFLEAPPDLLRSQAVAQLEFFEVHVIYRAGPVPYLGGFESPAGGTNNMSYRRSVLAAVAGFDEAFPVPAGEDADLKKRVVGRGYPIGYWPIKVTHLDSYSFGSFVRRSFIHGVGSAFFEAKHGRSLTGAGRLRQFLLWPVVGLKSLRLSGSFRLAALMTLKNLLMTFGQLSYFHRVSGERARS